MQSYIKYSTNLRKILCLIDTEHGYYNKLFTIRFKQVDYMTLELLEKMNKQFTICFTKKDKVNDSDVEKLKIEAEKLTKKYIFCDPIMILTSARSGAGISEIRANITFSIIH